ncbi:kinase-like protein, partial [Macrolepiota fuliginosa MF-IS2]
ILVCLCALARTAEVYPQCYTLKGIQKESHPRAAGGFSDVFRGTYEKQTLCIKVIRRDQQPNQYCDLTVRELLLWAHLRHQNILPFYGVYFLDEDKRQMCLVSPWMQNGNLEGYLNKHPEVPRMPLVLDVIEGVLYLHRSHIVHSDLKSVNVLVSAEGRAMIGDFGISRVATTNQTHTDSPNGTARWQAPELLVDSVERNVRGTMQSDIWSLGCLCYKILSRRDPFYQYSSIGRVYLALNHGDTPIRPETGADHDSISDTMWGLLGKCWIHEPKDRPSCVVVRDFVVRLKLEDDRPKAPGLSNNNYAFRGAMEARSGVRLDYDQIERILHRASNFLHHSIYWLIPDGLLRSN